MSHVFLTGGDLARVYAAGLSYGRSPRQAGEALSAFLKELENITGKAPHVGDPVMWDGSADTGLPVYGEVRVREPSSTTEHSG